MVDERLVCEDRPLLFKIILFHKIDNCVFHGIRWARGVWWLDLKLVHFCFGGWLGR